MNIPFFEQFLMISSPTTVGILVLFVALLGVVYYLQRKNTDFGTLVIAGTLLGAVLGLVVQVIAGFPTDPMKVAYVKESTKWFSLVGGGFIDLIRMLVIPLVFISIIHVILHMSQGANLKKLVTSTLGVALTMVSIAAIVGLTLGSVTHLGQGMSAAEGASKMREVKPVVDTLRALIPNNPVNAMATTNVIAVVVFAVVIGGIARLIKTTGTNQLELVTKLFDELHLIISWAADFIIGLMPYGVLALLASTLAQRGFAAIRDMGLFIVLIYVGVAIMLVVQSLLLMAFGLNPVTYFKKAKSVLLLAFTSRSSVGALPATINALTEKLGVNDATANTVASFGTTAGMQGCAGIFPALCIVYISNVAGIQLDMTMYVMSVIVVALGSLGIAGIPGTATMSASVSLSGTGLGAYFGMISPVLAVDPIVDMGRTMLNVSGSMTNAIVVDRLLGTFNKEAFDAEVPAAKSSEADR
ncbi:cation:dicarboxylase symporter family transporter [Acidaminococcus sp. NSJ-142]|jgi:L-cystine uptake protein TcyP (sodium:dicarboxylate symporter family)|uniref:cation:dicarboxylate symporter family transporter n=1 Tax=Acidaminococcus TaxID=904 RepID=UPI000CF9CCB5|nr:MULTISPECIES: cation:dicarboxylase symporter family transporter [Acidaminococcus]MCD2436110.1 cation:dicarboxylase symporter family transporter [Acidaminococcus hominis]MCH4096087.1 cation:dicarboxylase symporter family transporter [Acidaminococcus provencensis]